MEITEEMQTAIDAAVEARVAEETKGLKEKRDQVLKDNRELKNAKTAAEQAAADAVEESQRQAGDITALETTLKNKYNKEIEQLQADLKNVSDSYSKLVIDDQIMKTMVDANVPKHLHEPLKAMFKLKSEVKDGVAIYNDEPLATSLPAYFKTPEGMEYTTAPETVGTGATGGSKTTTDVWSKAPSTPDEQFRFAQLSTQDPVTFNNLCDRFNMPERKV